MKVGRIERAVMLAIGVGLALLIACGDDEGSTLDAGGTSSSSSSGGSSGTSGMGVGDGGTTRPTQGVLLIHAAGFPSMRVCFSGYPDLPPQPDRKVLPQANVVGLDVGGVVRLGPMLTAPGDVFVFLQQTAVATPGQTAEKTCRQLLKGKVGTDYWRAGTITRSVGDLTAEALVINGCGPSLFLDSLHHPISDCGADYGLPETASGNFKTSIITLRTTNTTTDMTMPMTLTNLSPVLNGLAPEGFKLDVSFGTFANVDGGTRPLATKVPLDSELYVEGKNTTLDVALLKEDTFGRDGFRIGYRESDGGGLASADAGGFIVDQSLATIQANSRADGNPTTYYRSPTNFAFFLVGDPRVQSTYADGGTDPAYPRRGLHLLAIPVRDDSEAQPLGDAGASDASTPDTGDAGDAGVK